MASLDEHLGHLSQRPPRIEEEKDDLGKCCGLVLTNKTVTCLQLRFNSVEQKKHGKARRQLQYKDIDSDDAQSGYAAEGTSFSVVFGYREPQRLTVYGRNLLKVWEYICFHRMPWIESVEPGRDFERGDKPVITGIVLEEVDGS